jgi:hypothetical protein
MNFKSTNPFNPLGLILFTLVVLALSVDYAFRIQDGLIKFLLGLIWLLYSVYEYSIFDRKRRIPDFFEVSTNNWVTSWAQGAFFLYWFYDEQLTLWTVGGIASIFGFVILNTIQNFKNSISITSDGIEELNSKRKIPKSIITDVGFEQDRICVHTTKYRNDLVIKLRDIKEADQAKAIQSFKDLKDDIASTPNSSEEGN